MIHRRHGFLCVACAVAIGALSTTADGGIVERVYRDADGEHQYRVYVPRGDAPERGWPVMLYLHGAGGRGTDGERHLNDGPARLLTEDIIDWPILVVFPQCEDTESPIFECWQADSSDAQRALRILAEVERDYAVDSEHRILAGWSMGGYGAWSVAAATPDRWAAVMPIAGGGDTAIAQRLRETRIWAVHGRLDQAILPERSREMVRAVRRAGGSAALTLLSNVDHGTWPYVFASRAVLDWFLNPDELSRSDERLQSEARAMLQSDAFERLRSPFTPELIIPHAVSVRLGERAIEAISFGIPQRVAEDALGASLDDIHATINTPDDELEVDLGEMKYRARLARCEIETSDQGRALLRLGIAPLEIEIGQTKIVGRNVLVTTNKTLIHVGHLRPVWAEVEVRPAVENHQLRLNLEQARFEIPDDNWFIRAPTEINVYGDGLSEDMVRIGIVGGLYQRRAEFETCICNTLPNVVRKVESLLAPGDMKQLASAIWPLPVYQPRLRLRLDDLAVDQHGISVMLGLEADPAVGFPSPRAPRVLAPLGPPAIDVHRSDWLEFGIAPDILAPLAQMLIDAGAARIDLSDLPHPQLAELGSRGRLREFVPALLELPDDVEVKAELVMLQPFQLRSEETVEATAVAYEADPGSSTIPAVFHARDLQILVSTRVPGLESPWTPLAELMLELEQPMLGSLVRHQDGERAIRVRWNGPPRVMVSVNYSTPVATIDSSQFPSDSQIPVDTNRFAELFTGGWQAWTASVANTDIDAPDLDWGGSPLRIEQVQKWPASREPTPRAAADSSPVSAWWLATYQSPATQLLNPGSDPLVYQARGPYSIWCVPRNLPPGERHTYHTPYPLSIRIIEPTRARTVTVEAGQMLELQTDW